MTPYPQVKDDPRQTPLGSLSVPLSRLLSAPELTLTEPFALQHAAPNSRLHLTLVLRVSVGLGGGSRGGIGTLQLPTHHLDAVGECWGFGGVAHPALTHLMCRCCTLMALRMVPPHRPPPGSWRPPLEPAVHVDPAKPAQTPSLGLRCGENGGDLGVRMELRGGRGPKGREVRMLLGSGGLGV